MDIIPTLAIGAVSQAVASTATYPYQVIKARLQQGGEAASNYKGTWDCTTKIIRCVIFSPLSVCRAVTDMQSNLTMLATKGTLACSRGLLQTCSR
jgi:hypothetical protein